MSVAFRREASSWCPVLSGSRSGTLPGCRRPLRSRDWNSHLSRDMERQRRWSRRVAQKQHRWTDSKSNLWVLNQPGSIFSLLFTLLWGCSCSSSSSPMSWARMWSEETNRAEHKHAPSSCSELTISDIDQNQMFKHLNHKACCYQHSLPLTRKLGTWLRTLNHWTRLIYSSNREPPTPPPLI